MDDQNSNVQSQCVAVKCPGYPRIHHQTLVVGNEVLIFGGIGPTDEPIRSILRFNLENSRTEQILDASSPSIEGFSTFLHKGDAYFWGGFVDNHASQSLYIFDGTSFKIKSQSGDIPASRAFHSSVWVANRYLLIYGGFNETEIFNTWHIFDSQNFCWKNVQANMSLARNKAFQMGWKNGRGFLITSEQVTRCNQRTNVQVRNQVFQFRITNYCPYKLRIDPIVAIGATPPPRSNPSLVFTNDSIWMFGGQLFEKKSKSICSDIWAFNIESLVWKKVMQNSLAKTRSSPVLYFNKVFLFGGLRSLNDLSPSVDVFTFKAPHQTLKQICTFCKHLYGLEDKDTPNLQIKPTNFRISVKEVWEPVASISTSFLSKLAHTLHNPIQAFGLLVDNSLNMSASLITINYEVQEKNAQYYKESPAYLLIGDNSRPFTIDELTKMLYCFRYKFEKTSSDQAFEEEMRIRNEYGVYLKMASLRLGKSCLFVSRAADKSIFVGAFSEYSRECPDGEPNFNCYYYVVSPEGHCSSSLDKEIIDKNFQHILPDSIYLEMGSFSTKVYIDGLYDIARGGSDLVFCPSGVNLTLNSLSDYLSKLYLSPYLGRQIRINGNSLHFVDLQAKFCQDRVINDLLPADTGFQDRVFKNKALYRVKNPAYPTNFIYIYHQNRLITALTTKDKSVCGFIEIPETINIDFFKSRLEKFNDEKKLQLFIQDKEDSRKRVRPTDGLDGYESLRKMKPTCLDL